MMIAKPTVLQQLFLGMTLCLFVTTTGQAWAQAKASPPATVAEARKLIDLTKLPRFEGAMPPDPKDHTWCWVVYKVPADPKVVYDFHRKQLQPIAKKWKDAKPIEDGPDGLSYSGTLQKDGYTVKLEVSPLKGGIAYVRIRNYGNVDLTNFAFPLGKKVPDETAFDRVTYGTKTLAPAVRKAVMKLLKDKGWQPFEVNDTQMEFIQNGMRLDVLIFDEESPGIKTSITLMVSLMSVELPAMPDVTNVEHFPKESLDILKFDTKAKPAAVADFYIKSLAKTGWKSKETALKKGESAETMTFQNAQLDTFKLEVTTNEGTTHVELTHQPGTAPPGGG